MSVNCLSLQHSVISASSVTIWHALMAPALQTARQIKVDRNSIHSGELLPNESM